MMTLADFSELVGIREIVISWICTIYLVQPILSSVILWIDAFNLAKPILNHSVQAVVVENRFG